MKKEMRVEKIAQDNSTIMFEHVDYGTGNLDDLC